MLTEQASAHIRGLSDAGLIEYLRADAETYDPDAIAFAWQEFDRRRLDPGVTAQLVAADGTRAAQEEARRIAVAAQRLDWAGKVLSFAAGFFGLPLIPMLIVWLRFHERGEYQKVREMWTLAGLGLATVIAIGIVWEIVQRFVW